MSESLTDITEKIDYFLSCKIKEGWSDCFSVAVADRNDMLYEQYIGATDATPDGRMQSVNQRTRFNIASATKPITAALIVKLMDEGELTLSDPVRRFIPEYPFEQITVQHLLDHSAGYDWEKTYSPKNFNAFHEYMNAMYSIKTLKFETGTRSEYFSAGFNVLMDIIQRVSATDLESFAQQHFFEPLRMQDTSFQVQKVKYENTVFPKRTDGEAELFLGDLFVIGESGLYSNPGDLLKIGQMLLQGGSYLGKSIFHERTASFLLQEYTGNRFRKTPAFWMKTDVDTFGCFGDLHSGSAVGHTGYSGCMFWIDPMHNRTGAVLTNSIFLHTDWKRYKRINNMLMQL
ncbi:beta-lactamase family protein [Paenibacillus sp. J5C_2022]|uniref:serine hydrolase domain-containing protein n=1 Tax=Paenibacillus sp. J5C2022 TaxID=2977129 RepID=UPI0021CFCAF1|nr:serine hydrolase domain-containing protein [Paenibacillus sp. J5C2022]MCU6710936.1 beta-lactamase family protein [Paenibacillus sp. J5C2022]